MSHSGVADGLEEDNPKRKPNSKKFVVRGWRPGFPLLTRAYAKESKEADSYASFLILEA